MRDVFGSWQEEPDQDAFASFQVRLDAANRKRQKRLLVYRATSAAALLLALLIPFSWYLIQGDSVDVSLAPEPPHVEPQPPQPYIIEDSLVESPPLSDFRFSPTEEGNRRPADFETSEHTPGLIPEFTGQDGYVTAPDSEYDSYSRLAFRAQTLFPLGVDENRPGEIVFLPAHDLSATDTREPDYQIPVTRQADQSSKKNLRFLIGSAVTRVPDDSSPGFGFSLGATHGRNITHRLGVETGGILSYTSFGVDRSEEFSTLVNSHFSTLGTSSTSLTSSLRQDTELMMLDIPLNLRLMVHSGSIGRIDVSGGLSSLVYLQQTFRDRNAQVIPEEITDPNTETTVIRLSQEHFETTDREGAFSRFEPFQLLNLSLSYHLPDTRNNLSAEFFVKYPLGSLTDRNQDMTTMGIALRYGIW